MAKRQNHIQQKHAAKLELADKKSAAGLISERFPHVSGITVRLTYYGKTANSVLVVRTVNYFPESDAYFYMNCMTKDCEVGGFDMSRVVADVIKKKMRSGKGKMVCCDGAASLSASHSSISYEIAIQYRK